MESLLLQLVSGAAGGNAAAQVDKKQDLGLVGNSIAGLAGGLVGSQLLEQFIGNAVNGMVGDIGGAAVSGAITIYLVNMVRGYMKK